MLVVLLLSLALNVYLFLEADYFAKRALSEQQLRRQEQAEYIQFVDETSEKLKTIKRERDELILRHEQVRPIPDRR